MVVNATTERFSLTTPLQVFTGRHRPDLAGVPVEAITDWESTPWPLTERLSSAPGLVVWDPLGFPWDSLRYAMPTLPVWVVVDSSRPEAESLIELLGEEVLSRLTFLDRVVTDSEEITETLAARYGLGRGQIGIDDELDPTEVLARALAELSHPDLDVLAGWRDVDAYWEARADLLADSHPARAILDLHGGLAWNKALHVQQERALRPFLTGSNPSREWSIAEVGCGIGRWVKGLPPHVRYAGFDTSEAMLSAARTSFPHHEFGPVGPRASLPLIPETCDVVFTCSVMHHNPPRRRLLLIESMLSIAKVGGTLAFMEDFVPTTEHDDLVVSYPLGIRRFMDEIQTATSGAVVLQHVESLGYPSEPSRRTALIAVTKTGSPRHL
jgi:SAM-dependent methyltransferase